MAHDKYLVVYRGRSVIPQPLRAFVQQKITTEFSSFKLELDFTGSRRQRDLVVQFTNDIPIWGAYGESTRPTIGGEVMSGDSTVFVGLMRAMRLQTSAGQCEPAFPATEDALGQLIANTAIHETAHMLGLDTGGFDSGGHVSPPDNYMWASVPATQGTNQTSTRVSPIFEYTVKTGDTLSGIVDRYRRGVLDTCRIGPTKLTYQMVWDHPANKQMGFVAHPTKSGKAGRRVNDPNWIYPGEKVGLINQNLRTQQYRQNFRGFLGMKTFTDQQVETMKDFIARRLADGTG